MKISSATKLHEAFIKGELSAETIVSFYLQRIEKLNPHIKAFLSLFNEDALSRAHELDVKRRSGKPMGRLAGLPIALKDNIHKKGTATTCASQFLKNYKAPFDATVTRLIEDEDGIIIGKTNLDEFAMGSSMENSSFGLTHNPWDLNCSPGGSSGGSAAAVAAQMVPLALGSDTGGSVRQPASFCGIVGLKPTYGRISRYGLVAFGSSLDQIGPFARSVEDTALILDVIANSCSHDATSVQSSMEPTLPHLNDSLKGKTVGVPWSFLENLDEESLQNFKTSLKLYQDMGVNIVEISLPILKYSIPCYYILATAEASTNLARFDGVRYGLRSKAATTLDELYDLSREEGFGPEVKNRILLGTFVLSSGHKDAFYKKGQQVRTLFIREFQEAFNHCDMIAMPTTPNAAFPFGKIHSTLEMYLQDIFTTPANLAGLPAISVLSGFTAKSHLPLGLQLLGPHLHESKLLNFAHLFEKALALNTNEPNLERFL